MIKISNHICYNIRVSVFIKYDVACQNYKYVCHTYLSTRNIMIIDQLKTYMESIHIGPCSMIVCIFMLDLVDRYFFSFISQNKKNNYICLITVTILPHIPFIRHTRISTVKL